MLHDGVEYEYVFQIDVKDDEPPLPLPFNLEGASRLRSPAALSVCPPAYEETRHADDPHTTAATFVEAHSLPESYAERIVDFIRASTTAA